MDASQEFAVEQDFYAGLGVVLGGPHAKAMREGRVRQELGYWQGNSLCAYCQWLDVVTRRERASPPLSVAP
jgi:hypothetical protein